MSRRERDDLGVSYVHRERLRKQKEEEVQTKR